MLRLCGVPQNRYRLCVAPHNRHRLCVVQAEVETVEVGPVRQVQSVQPAQRQPEVHQQPVLRHVARQQARAPSLQEPQLGVAVHPERAGAEKRQAVARAAFGTGGVTVEFIIAQRTACVRACVRVCVRVRACVRA